VISLFDGAPASSSQQTEGKRMRTKKDEDQSDDDSLLELIDKCQGWLL